MSKLPQNLPMDPENLTGSLMNFEWQPGGTADESSNTLPDIFNIQPEIGNRAASKLSPNLWTSRRPSTNSEFECRFPPRDPNARIPDAVAYTSFGDGDTTASVTSFGQIMQITRFLGEGTSGFFSVDQPDVTEPWYVENRARKIMELSSVGTGIDFSVGPFLPGWLHQIFRRKPMLDFVRDRWPRFTTSTTDCTTTTQFFVHDSTVFGSWTCRSKGSPLLLTRSISFRANQLIRELEFLNTQHSFNEASRNTEKTYQTLLGPDDESLIIAHCPSPGEKIFCSIGVVIVFYVNGKRQKIQKAKSFDIDKDGQIYEVVERDMFHITLDQEQLEIQSSHPLEITTAHRLQKLPEGFDTKLHSVPLPSYYTFDDVLGRSPYAQLSFTPDKYVDFIVRRNLEHILSVCSIPIKTEQPSNPMIALTCGDMSGHRLTATASFFAFQFLLSVFKHLNKSDLDESYRDYLRERIRNTCEWHLNWLFEKADKPSYQFADYYWATGEAMRDPQSGEPLKDRSLKATPLQIIKQSDFVTVMTEVLEDNIKRAAKSRLEDVIPYWLRTLDETDKRGFSAFPQPGTQQYCLEDHVWIWRALKSIQSLDLGTYLRAEGGQIIDFSSTEEGYMKMMSAPSRPLSGDYLPEEIQRKVLKRFTTGNTASGRRMIAVSRTPAETRFMFYSTDVTLLYGSNAPFFDKARPLWKATIESQKFYQEN